MAFKLRSPLHTDNPYRAKSKAIVTAHAKAVADYKPGSKANPTYGTAENIKEADLKAKGKRTNLPLEKPELAKNKSNNLPSSQGGGSPFNIGQAAAQRDKSNAEFKLRSPLHTGPKTLMGTLIDEGIKAIKNTNASPGNLTSRSADANNRINKRGKYAEKVSSSKGSGVVPNTNIDPNVNKRPEYKIPGTGSSTVKPKNTVKPSSNTNTSTSTTKPSNTTTTLSTGSNTNADKSGGYLKDTKNFSLGVDTKLNVAPMPKFERTVTNARSADYDMIRAKGRGKIDRLKTRLDKREGRVANRVEASSMRIKSRQKRSGNRYASKMEARTNTGTNPGYSTEQKKLDAFEKSMDSPKAPSLRTPKSNQTVAKPSMKLNTSRQTSITIDDNKIKSGAKKGKGGQKVKASTYESLTGFKNKKGSSDGMRRGVSSASTSIKRNDLSKGPRV